MRTMTVSSDELPAPSAALADSRLPVMFAPLPITGSAKRDQSTTTNGLISRASAFVPHDGDHDPQLEHEPRLHVDEQHFAFPAYNGYAGSIWRHQAAQQGAAGLSRSPPAVAAAVWAYISTTSRAFLCRMRSAILVVATSSSPRLSLRATRLRIVVGLHRDTLARRPPQGSSTHLPFPLTASSMLPAIYPVPWSLPPPTPPSHASIHGRDFVATRVALIPLLQLAWEVPHRCVRVRDGGGGQRPRDARMRTAEEQVCLRASYRGIEACVRPPTRARVFAPPQDGRYLPLCERIQSSMHERTRLAEGRLTLARPHLDAMPPRQRPCSDIRSRRPQRAPAQRCPTRFSPCLHRHRPPPSPAPQPRHLPSSVRRSVLRVYVGLRLIFSSPAPPAPGSALPIYSTSIIVAPLRGGEPHETHRSALPPQVRQGVGDGKAGRKTTVCISVCSSREDERRARRALHEARCHPVRRHPRCRHAGARMQDGETCGVRWSMSSSSSTSAAGAGSLKIRGGEDDEERRDALEASNIQPLVLGGSISLSQDGWCELRRDEHYGMTTVPDVYHNTLLAPRVCAAHLASASLHHLPVLLRTPHPYLHTRSCRLPSQLPGPPPSRARLWRFESRIWMGSRWIGRCGLLRCVQALARRGWRRKNSGVGRGAMEAPTRRSGAEPRRTKLALGGRCGVGDPGVSRVGSRMRSVYVCGGAVVLLLWPPTTLGSHHIAFFHLSVLRGKENRRIFSDTWMQGRGADRREDKILRTNKFSTQ
ncbi:hypothetical protein B0H14DRAFT_2634592 [Mycena olivaceomarginata]|nr:hypothetical protein B0H14DRAFT_2634592 [Mycena olivaceomarginata]